MKKATLKAIVDYLNGMDVTNIDEVKAEVEAEYAKGEEKARANRELYAEAYKVFMPVIDAEAKTAKEIFALADAPEGFTLSKLQYALREMWKDEVLSLDNGKNPKTYIKA